MRKMNALGIMLSFLLLPAAVFSAGKPAVLFSIPGEIRYIQVGLDYLRELQKQGFEADYCEGSAQFTWDRVKNYNAVVIISFPPKDAKQPQQLFAVQPPWAKEYLEVLDRFVKSGGGVFLFITNTGGYIPNEELKTRWGLELPLAVIHDSDVQFLSHLNPVYGSSACAYTNDISAGPVTEGVKGLWYPIDQHYTGGHTMPVLPDSNWKSLVRMGRAAWTEPPQYTRGSGIVPDPGSIIPQESIKNGTFLAVREFPGGGRMAAMQSWHQFTIGSGMKWLFNNEVLETGLAGRQSDFGRLLANTYRWLAEPSLKSGTVGGHVTDSARLLEPQLRPDAQEKFHEWIVNEEDVLGYRYPPKNGKIFRGIIGAETNLSGGQGTVAEFAKASVEAKLDFVVFLEDFDKLSPEKLKTLAVETRKYSSPTLVLLPGYRMKSNIGNHIFVFGRKDGYPWWPEDRLLVGPDKKTFNLQYQNEKGEWAHGNPASDWLINCAGNDEGNVGYYRFCDAPQGMKLYDARDYSMAAVRTYEDGKLIEDLTDDYLTTCQCPATPTPVSVNIVRSPRALKQAAVGGQALTYVQAKSVEMILTDGLRWSHQYDGINVFPSDGPIILAWPKEARVLTFGAERFVTERALDIAPVHVTSAIGLKEVSIYNGRDLFRRFLPEGAKDFQATLFLSGVVQRNLVLVATDNKGGRAVSFAHRSFKDGATAPIFGGDHVNDLGFPGHCLLAHGPFWPYFFATPNMPAYLAGFTWDGGPSSNRIFFSGYTTPSIETSDGSFNYTPYNLPLLEFSDEAATRCRSQGGRRLSVPNMYAWGFNPWYGFGPVEPDPLFDSFAAMTIFNSCAIGVDPLSYGGPGIQSGPIASLFTEELISRKDMTIRNEVFFNAGCRKRSADRSVVIAFGKQGNIKQIMDASILPDKPLSWTVETGDWFGFFSSDAANAQLFINRGTPFQFELNPPGATWIKFRGMDTPRELKAGGKTSFEVFALIWPLDQPITTGRDMADTVAYLSNPTGLELKRGKRVAGPGGLFELAAEDGTVELSIPKPEVKPVTLPVRIEGFNKRWTVGLYQCEGYRTHYYSKENSGWTELGLAFDGKAYVPLYVSMSPRTHVLIGHPVVADQAGKNLFIQVTRINDGVNDKPPVWHISVNNPTDKPVKSVIRKTMDLAGLDFAEQQVELRPGEYKALP